MIDLVFENNTDYFSFVLLEIIKLERLRVFSKLNDRLIAEPNLGLYIS